MSWFIFFGMRVFRFVQGDKGQTFTYYFLSFITPWFCDLGACELRALRFSTDGARYVYVGRRYN